jgi:hypothetical protein
LCGVDKLCASIFTYPADFIEEYRGRSIAHNNGEEIKEYKNYPKKLKKIRMHKNKQKTSLKSENAEIHK